MVGRGRRMTGKAFCVAEIIGDIDKFEPVEEPECGFLAAGEL